ncbi:MAG: hypothetical protein H0X66_19495 [Verrucomicrobia bacterium]|nr:hypothetical protein [Verrucomicrobiota bacterium]
MNSRTKGKVGEREFAALLRENGFDARRGQQFSGSAESPDVVSEALAWLHVEVKRVQALNLADACAQAEGDCGGKPWIVAHRKNHAPWLITMTAETFFRLIRGDFPQPRMDTKGHEPEPHESAEASNQPPLLTSPPKAERNQQKEFRSDVEIAPTAENKN